jgi:hypothetical protein
MVRVHLRTAFLPIGDCAPKVIDSLQAGDRISALEPWGFAPLDFLGWVIPRSIGSALEDSKAASWRVGRTPRVLAGWRFGIVPRGSQRRRGLAGSLGCFLFRVGRASSLAASCRVASAARMPAVRGPAETENDCEGGELTSESTRSLPRYLSA